MSCTRAKRVTDPFGDELKARLFSSVSSGSDHSSIDDVDDSPCLSELVQGFFEDGLEEPEPRGFPPEPGSDSDSDSERVGPSKELTDAAEEIARTMSLYLRGDSYGSLLLAHVSKVLSFLEPQQKQCAVLRRNVMSCLRELGYNAAVCKAKWSSSGNLTAGSYEFIDVVVVIQSHDATCHTVRYFVDLDFVSQFEIARPTCQYARVIHSLPRVFVGKAEELKKIVKVTCDAAKRSLKSRNLTLPPWRKNRYMQMRWFGPYKRTVNSTPSAPAVNAVKCRAVGFDDTVNGCHFVRTR